MENLNFVCPILALIFSFFGLLWLIRVYYRKAEKNKRIAQKRDIELHGLKGEIAKLKSDLNSIRGNRDSLYNHLGKLSEKCYTPCQKCGGFFKQPDPLKTVEHYCSKHRRADPLKDNEIKPGYKEVLARDRLEILKGWWNSLVLSEGTEETKRQLRYAKGVIEDFFSGNPHMPIEGFKTLKVEGVKFFIQQKNKHDATCKP